MQENTRLKIGITIGDMNGIGPEIILKTFADNPGINFVKCEFKSAGSNVSKTSLVLLFPFFLQNLLKLS